MHSFLGIHSVIQISFFKITCQGHLKVHIKASDVTGSHGFKIFIHEGKHEYNLKRLKRFDQHIWIVWNIYDTDFNDNMVLTKLPQSFLWINRTKLKPERWWWYYWDSLLISRLYIEIWSCKANNQPGGTVQKWSIIKIKIIMISLYLQVSLPDWKLLLRGTF